LLNSQKFFFPDSLNSQPCKLCQNADPDLFALKYVLPTCEIVSCLSCGFTFVPAKWRKNITYTTYKNSKTAQQIRKGNNWVKIQRHKLRLKFIKKYISSGKLLDVGCGWGHFLLAAQEEGFSVTGVELDEQAWLYSVQDLNLPVQRKDFFTFSDKDNFDLITMWDVLEHIDDPVSFLKNAARLQKDGTYLVLQVPQIDSFVSRLMKKHWKMLGLDHVNYFSPQTIKILLNQCGYEMLEHKTSLELKLLLMYTILPLIHKIRIFLNKIFRKNSNLIISTVDNSERQAFFNQMTQRPMWQLKIMVFVHNLIYYFLSFFRIGEEMMVIARRRTNQNII